MNKNELLKRIISSIVLIPICILAILQSPPIFIIFIFLIYLFSIHEWHKMSKGKVYELFGFIFLTISFYSLYKIRFGLDGEYLYLFFTLLICISTDIGGYTFGKIFKGPKLTKISPNKTIVGIIGSYIFSFISIYILVNYSKLNFTNTYKDFLFIIILISTVSQLGDLLISYFKRLSKIKDTGKLIPGHGGILDRIDGMIFAIPFSYFLFSTNLFKL